MAQGTGDRWKTFIEHDSDPPCEYKQLLPVDGEPNLFRTIRMLREKNRNDFIVIAEGLMFTDSQIDSLPNQIRTLRCPGDILNGISQLLKFNESFIFLLGDVIYSQQLLADILSYDEREYTLWGRKGGNKYTGKAAKEIFALSVSIECVSTVIDQISHIKDVNDRNLWSLYHSFIYTGNWEEVNDWTDDVDSPEEYSQFFGFLEVHVIKENKA